MADPRPEPPVFRERALLYRQSAGARTAVVMLLGAGYGAALGATFRLGHFLLKNVGNLPLGAIGLMILGVAFTGIGLAVDGATRRKSLRPRRVLLEVQNSTLSVDGTRLCGMADLGSGAIVEADASTRTILWTSRFQRPERHEARLADLARRIFAHGRRRRLSWAPTGSFAPRNPDYLEYGRGARSRRNGRGGTRTALAHDPSRHERGKSKKSSRKSGGLRPSRRSPPG